MSGHDLDNELHGKQRLLETALGELGRRGRDNANAEKEYRVAVAKRIVIERQKGTPVTIISDLVRGDEEIAQLKFQRDVAEVAYKGALEAINVYKLAIRTLESQIDREWNRA